MTSHGHPVPAEAPQVTSHSHPVPGETLQVTSHGHPVPTETLQVRREHCRHPDTINQLAQVVQIIVP